MMTEALLAVYPDIFKAGSSFAGVAAGCWSAGWSAASNWGGTCAGGNYTQTAQQWGDKVRAMSPGYSGYRPRAQLFHGDSDAIISYKNLAEGIKEWTNVLGLSTSPTSTDTGLTLGAHQATRQRWQNSCGYVVLEAITSIGGDHGPSDALFNSSYVIPFLGLDQTGPIDPEVAQCGAGGSGGSSGGTGGSNGGNDGGRGGASGSAGAGGSSGTGGRAGSGGSSASGGSAGNGATSGPGGNAGSGASGGSQGSGGGGSGGALGMGGQPGIGGSSIGRGSTDGGAGGAASTAAAGAPGGDGSAAAGDAGSSGCSCELGAAESNWRSGVQAAIALALALCAFADRRRRAVCPNVAGSSST
jgi:hypothetical protein